MKLNKLIYLIFATLMITLCFTACDISDHPDNTDMDINTTDALSTAADPDITPSVSEYNLDDCNITIKDAIIVENLGIIDPVNVVIITYEFINYSNEAKEFGWMVTHNVFQDGIECAQYYGGELLLDNDLKYESNIMIKVQPNIPIDIKVMYKLNDLTSPIEVICSSYLDLSTDPDIVSREFDING